MLRCAITDRSLWPGDESDKRAALARQARRWAELGIEMIQLREKDLPAEAVVEIAREILRAISSSSTRLLINSDVDAAVHAMAHGVHLSSDPALPAPAQVAERYRAAGLPIPLVTVSCHTIGEIERARPGRPDAILFAPVFGKVVAGRTVTPAVGLEALRSACRAAAPIPVLALGGVTHENIPLCLEAGAAGVAGIRLFHNP